MDVITKKQILESIERVYEKAKKSKLEHSFLESIEPDLDQKDCQILAEKFNFSGGQIDNIIRKSEIQEIVYGKIPDFKQLQSFCNEELISANNTKIGFGHANN